MRKNYNYTPAKTDCVKTQQQLSHRSFWREKKSNGQNDAFKASGMYVRVYVHVTT